MSLPLCLPLLQVLLHHDWSEMLQSMFMSSTCAFRISDMTHMTSRCLQRRLARCEQLKEGTFSGLGIPMYRRLLFIYAPMRAWWSTWARHTINFKTHELLPLMSKHPLVCPTLSPSKWAIFLSYAQASTLLMTQSPLSKHALLWVSRPWSLIVKRNRSKWVKTGQVRPANRSE